MMIDECGMLVEWWVGG